MTNFTAARYPGDTQCSTNPGETLTIDGITYRRHPNGGGFVAETARVAPTAFVGLFAKVYGDAEVFDNAKVFGKAVVYGDAKVFDNAEVGGGRY